MRNLPPIGIHGKFRSGKDEVAKYLRTKYGYTRYAFADEMKRLYFDLFEDQSSKPREGLVWFGQTMRERDPEIWIRKCFELIEAHREQLDFIQGTYGNRAPFLPAISDLRLPNEYDRLKDEGYVIIRVEAASHVRMYRAILAGDDVTVADLSSITETALDGHEFDYTLENNGTLDELYAQIDEMMSTLRRGGQ